MPDNLSGAFFGLWGDTASAGQYSDLTDIMGFGFDANDTTLSLMHNNGSGTCTSVDLGADFPRTVGAFYRFYLYWSPDQSAQFSYVAVREDDLTVTPLVGDRTTDLPSITIGPVIIQKNYTSALAHALCMDEYSFWSV
jgi:hypothetical protein